MQQDRLCKPCEAVCLSHEGCDSTFKATQSLSYSSSPTNTLNYVMWYNEVLHMQAQDYFVKQTGTEQSMHCKLQLSKNIMVHRAEGYQETVCL